MRKRGAKVYCEKSRARKHIFPTQEKAEQYMRNMILNARTLEDGLPQRVYYCEACGGWHMTSKAHILQKYIDDGSAVLNPTPIVVEQMPETFILHEEKIQELRNFYESWERKCKVIQTQIEKQQIMGARSAVAKLIKNRVRKQLGRLERENFTDWRKRLVNKTLILQRRINNILNGNTRKNRSTIVEPVIKFRYVPEPDSAPNPMIIIAGLKDEVSVLLEQLGDPSFISSLMSNGDCYKTAKKSVKRATRLIHRNDDDIDIAFACFSVGADPLKSIVDGYTTIHRHLIGLYKIVINEGDSSSENRLRHLAKVVKDLLNMMKEIYPKSHLNRITSTSDYVYLPYD